MKDQKPSLKGPDGPQFGNKPRKFLQNNKFTNQGRNESGRPETEYQVIFNAVDDLIVIFDSETLEILDINQACLQQLGYTSSELKRLTIKDLFGQEEPYGEEEVQKVLMQAKEKAVSIVEWPCRKKTGEHFWAEGSFKPVNIMGRKSVIAVGRDITERKKNEKRTQEKGDQYRQLVELSKDIITVHDFEGKILFINQAGLNLIGASDSSDILNKNLFDFIPDDAVDSIKNRIKHIKDGKKSVPFITRKIRRLDGIEVYIESAGGPIVYQGKPCIQVVSRDVTERKLMEDSLRKSQEKFFKVFHNTPFMKGITRRKDGRIIDVNKAFESGTGYSKKEIKGKTTIELNLWRNPDVRQRLIDNLAKGRPVLDAEIEINTRSGEVRTCLMAAESFTINGEPHLLTIANDITEKKQIEEKLERSQKRYREIFDSVTDMIFIQDPKTGEILDVNKTWLTENGYHYEEVVGQDASFFSLHKAPYSKEDADRMLAKADKEGPLSFEWPGRKKNGESYWAEIYLIPSLIEDRETIIAIGRDITERKVMEDNLRKSQEKFFKAFEDSPLVKTISRLEDGLLIDVNKAFVDVTGYTKDEIKGKTATELNLWLKPDGREQWIRKLKEGEPFLNIEVEFKSKHGDVIIGIMSAELFELNGEPHILTLVNDVTQKKLIEKELKIAQERYLDIFNAVTDMISVHEAKTGKILDVNEAWIRKLGYRYEEAVGQNSNLFTLPEQPYTKEDADGMLAKAYEEGPQGFEWLARKKNGELIWGETNLIPRLIGGKESILAVTRDINERKKLEAELKKEREVLKNIIEFNPFGIAIYDKDGMFVEGNKAFLNLFKSKPPPGYCLFKDKVLLEYGFSTYFKKLRNGEYVNFPIIRYTPENTDPATAGDPVLARVVGFPVFDLNRKITNYILMHENITELELARKALKESEENYRNVVEMANDAIAIIQNQKIKYANRRTTGLLGYDLEELIGRSFKDFIDSRDLKRIDAIAQHHISQNVWPVRQYEAGLIRENGTRISVEFTSTRVTYENDLATLVILRDISDRKRIETRLRQSQKMEAIGALAGGIAHDFNNILTPIMGYAEMIMTAALANPSIQRKAREIQVAAVRAQELVQQILTFSRQTEHEKKPMVIDPIINEVMKLLRSTLPSTIELRLKNDNEGNFILADPTGIHQVLMNLCTNASHAMREKGGRLSVSIKKVELDGIYPEHHLEIEPGSYLRITVSDTGHGMDKATTEKIFSPYFTTKPEGEGTGMGLAVVHGIVKAHGGNINVYSEVDVGTTFNVFLPIIEHANGAGEEENAAVSKILPTGRERILLVDDEKQILSMIEEMLSGIGYRITARNSGVDAFEAFRAQPEKFDLVITDQTMPNMTGVDLAQRILRIRPELPIVLCTGYSEIVSAEKARRMGIREYIMKPVVAGDLAQTIRNVLDRC